VEQYIPRPLRCTKCQKFGHHHSRCRGTVSVCYRCSVSHSQETSCASDAPVKCVNCSGDHPSSSKQCPKYQQEQKIIKLKYTLNIPFLEARKRILSKPSLSYASLATVKTSSIGTQTESLSTEFTFQAKPPTLSVNTLPKASTNIPIPPSSKPGPSNKRTSSQQSARSAIRQYLHLLNHLKLKEISILKLLLLSTTSFRSSIEKIWRQSKIMM